VTLLPIKDDFVLRTLTSVPGLLGRLNYVAELREKDRYVHWGLKRVFGEETMQRAVAEIHRGLFLQVLRTPLRQLLQDAAHSAAAQHCQVRPYLQTVLKDAHSLVAPNLGGGSEAHFNSVVAALLSLL
jgi:hypothetical protein